VSTPDPPPPGPPPRWPTAPGCLEHSAARSCRDRALSRAGGGAPPAPRLPGQHTHGPLLSAVVAITSCNIRGVFARLWKGPGRPNVGQARLESFNAASRRRDRPTARVAKRRRAGSAPNVPGAGSNICHSRRTRLIRFRVCGVDRNNSSDPRNRGRRPPRVRIRWHWAPDAERIHSGMGRSRRSRLAPAGPANRACRQTRTRRVRPERSGRWRQ
jgi:hypothetical protein